MWIALSDEEIVSSSRLPQFLNALLQHMASFGVEGNDHDYNNVFVDPGTVGAIAGARRCEAAFNTVSTRSSMAALGAVFGNDCRAKY